MLFLADIALSLSLCAVGRGISLRSPNDHHHNRSRPFALGSSRTHAPRRHIPSPIALWSRHLVRRVRYARPSPSCCHYFTWVPLVTHDSNFALCPYVIIIMRYPIYPPRSSLAGGFDMITMIMRNVGRCSMLSGGTRPGMGTPYPPSLESLPPVPGSGTPTPRPGRDMPYTPLFLRGNASLSRSKPDAVLLVPRDLLWVSSARSSAFPLRPSLCFLAPLVALTADISLRSPPLCGFFSPELVFRQVSLITPY